MIAKIKAEIQVYKEKINKAQLNHAQNIDRNTKTVRKIDEELLNTALIQTAAKNIKMFVKEPKSTINFLMKAMCPQVDAHDAVPDAAELVEVGQEVKPQITLKAKDSIEIEVRIRG